VQSTSPVLASAISLVTFGVMILVLPFFQGGLLGMADEAIAGEARLGTLVAVGKANYVPLLLGYFVLLAVNMIFGFLAFMGAIIVIIGGSIAGMGGGVGTGMGGGAGTGVDAPVVGFDPTLLAVVGVVAVGLVLAYLLVTFFVQFYAHAVVLDGSELVDGFRRARGSSARTSSACSGTQFCSWSAVCSWVPSLPRRRSSSGRNRRKPDRRAGSV